MPLVSFPPSASSFSSPNLLFPPQLAYITTCFSERTQYLGAGRVRHSGRRAAAAVAWPILVHGRCGGAVLAQEAAICRKRGPGHHFTGCSLSLTRVPKYRGERGRTRYPQRTASPGNMILLISRLMTHTSSELSMRECTKQVCSV